MSGDWRLEHSEGLAGHKTLLNQVCVQKNIKGEVNYKSQGAFHPVTELKIVHGFFKWRAVTKDYVFCSFKSILISGATTNRSEFNTTLIYASG